MNRGIYPILSGALAQEERIQVLSNNVANLKTSGFKRVEPVFESVLGSAGRLQASSGSAAAAFQPVVGGSPSGMTAERVFVSTVNLSTNFAGGQLKQTGNPLDIAIDGPSFFEVQTPGGTFYTRNGSFRLDSQRRLVTEAGYAVMGDKGELKFKPGDVKVGTDGKITVDGKSAGRIKVVDFPGNEGVRQVGNGLFTGPNPQPVKHPTLSPGHLEESNVNSFAEMVKLIEVMRTYESAQKLLMTFDKTTETSIQDLGRAT